jgi:hypothetical protein
MNPKNFSDAARRFNRALVSHYPMLWSLRLHYVSLVLWPLLGVVALYYAAVPWRKSDPVPAIQQWSYFLSLVALGLLIVWFRVQLRAAQHPHLSGPFGGARYFFGALAVTWSLAWAPIEVAGVMRARISDATMTDNICDDHLSLYPICTFCFEPGGMQYCSDQTYGIRCPPSAQNSSRMMKEGCLDTALLMNALDVVREYGNLVPQPPEASLQCITGKTQIDPSCRFIRDNPSVASAIPEAYVNTSRIARYADPGIPIHSPQFFPLVYIISTLAAMLATVAQTTTTRTLLRLFFEVFGAWLALWLFLSITLELTIGSERGELANSVLILCVLVAAAIVLIALVLKRWRVVRSALLFIMVSLPYTPTWLLWSWINYGEIPYYYGESRYSFAYFKFVENQSLFVPDGLYELCLLTAAILGASFAIYRPIAQRAEAEPKTSG